jgi:heme peroxidase
MADSDELRRSKSQHGANMRGMAAGANPGQPFGRFGNMFDLPPGPVLSDEALADFATMMVKIDAGAPIIIAEPADENSKIPSGYTYFGQFVDHDITFDPTPLNAKQVDVDALVDFRTPALDLDSVYGRGPADQPYLYERDGLRLRVGKDMNTVAPPILAKVGTRNDVLRLVNEKDGEDKPAVLGDKRNDENKIVSQMHGAIIAFHNKVVMDDNVIMAFGGDLSSADNRFRAASTLVRWHYQWVVVNDFLKRICAPGTIEEVLNQGGTPRLQHYLHCDVRYAYMPVEFSGAAYRLGHSMVRPSYSLNAIVLTRKGDQGQGIPTGDPAEERIPTFSRTPIGTENLNGFPGTLPDFWGIDWSFFLDGVEPRNGGTKVKDKDGQEKDAVLPQPSYRIDANLVQPLGDLPEFFDPAIPAGSPASIVGNLAFRNLKRGQLLNLPSGQAVAYKLGIKPLSDEILWSAGSIVPTNNDTDQEIKDALQDANQRRDKFRKRWVEKPDSPLKENAPLWYYVLREAEYFGATDTTQDGAVMGGQHLGPVGSRIVAETFIGLLYLDKSSYLHSSRGFAPLGAITGGQPLTLGRLISYALT